MARFRTIYNVAWAGPERGRALLETLAKYVEAFRKLTSAYFQERIYDVKDVFRRILVVPSPRR